MCGAGVGGGIGGGLVASPATSCPTTAGGNVTAANAPVRRSRGAASRRTSADSSARARSIRPPRIACIADPHLFDAREARARSGSSARVTICCSRGSAGGGAGGPLSIALRSSAARSLKNTRMPPSSSCSTTPSENTSARASTPRHASTSGARYASVGVSASSSAQPGRISAAKQPDVDQLDVAFVRHHHRRRRQPEVQHAARQHVRLARARARAPSAISTAIVIAASGASASPRCCSRSRSRRRSSPRTRSTTM